MKKYYWMIAGALVGIMTVVLSIVNITLIFGQSNVSLTATSSNYIGIAIVVVIYTVVIYLLSLGQNLLKK